MTKTKKVVAVMLAFLMIFSSASVLASAWDASVDDGSTLEISTKFFKEVDGQWVETEKVRPGDTVKARVYLGTDYYSNGSTLLFFYDKDFFTHAYGTSGPTALEFNTEDGSFAATNNISGTFAADYDMSGKAADNGIDSAYLDEYSAMYVTLVVSGNNVMYDDSTWLFEFTLTVADDASGEGDLFVKESTIQSTSAEDAAVNVPKGPQDGTALDAWPMWLWDATPVLSSQPVSTISSVTFNANSGEYDDGSDTYVIEDTIDAAIDASTVPVPSKEGYSFMGWIDATDTTPTYEEIVAVPSAIPEDDLVLNAYWMENVTITFDTDGGSTIDPHENVTPYADFADVTPPTKDGYTFVGWDVRGNMDLPETYPDVSTTYTAIWALNVTVSFNTDGGTEIAPIDGVSGEPFDAAAIADPTKEGHNFIMWSPSLPTEFPSEDTTYNAIFETKTYRIWYYAVDDEGNTEASAVVQREYGTAIPTGILTMKLPEGKEFASETWYTDEACTVALADGATVEGNLKLYKKTQYASYDAIFIVDGEEYARVETVYGDEIVLPADPAKAGYVFDGWSPAATILGEPNDMTFYATWREAVNEAIYVVDGSEYQIYEVETGESLDVPADPYKEGYTFIGWTDTEGSTTTITLPDTMPTSTVTYYAVFEINEYTITFDTDEGTAVDSITKNYGEDIGTVAEPTKTGYTFKGWALTKGATEADKVTLPTTMPAEDQTYYAIWEINEYTITFVDTGDVAYEAITQDYNTAIDAVADPVKTGYTFTGWDTEIPATMPAEDLTITATWDANSYDAVFDANGGSWTDGDTTKTVPTDYNETIVAPADPAKTGYDFGGWTPAVGTMDDVNGKTFTAIWNAKGDTAYTVNIYTMGTDGEYGEADVKNLTGATDSKVTYTPDIATGFELNASSVTEGTVAADGSLVLNIYIDRTTYTLTVVVDNESTTTDYLYEEAVATPATPVKEGYTFTSWSPAVPSTMPAEDVTVTAQWQINSHKVTWTIDGAVTEENYNYGDTIVAPAAEKTGYAFKGWTPEFTEGTAMPDEDLAFTAVFEAISYDATFLADGGVFEENGTDTYVVSTAYDSAIVAPKNPTKTGYVFSGWTPATGMDKMDTVGGETYTATWSNATDTSYTVNVYTMGTDGEYGAADVKNLTGETNTTAKYEPVITDGFVLNASSVTEGTIAADGSLVLNVYIDRISYTFKAVSNGETMAEETYLYGAKITVPADPENKVGYTFVEWNPSIPSTMPANNLEVEAVFEANSDTEYMVVVNYTDLATGAHADEFYYSGTSDNAIAIVDEIPDPAVDNTEYVLMSDLAVDNYVLDTSAANDLTGTVAPDGSTVLNLYYIPVKYVATFNAVDGDYEAAFTDGDTTKTVELDYNSLVKVNAPADPVREGYTFAGWNGLTDATRLTGNRTFTPSWDANEYTITWVLDGTETVETYDCDETIVKKTAPTKVGYTFDKWVDADGNEIEIPDTMPAKNLVIKTTYTINAHTVTWINDDVTDVVNYNYGDTIEVTTPVKEGYTFDGWFDSEGKQPADYVTVPDKDLTFTAKWTINQYTITFADTGDSTIAPIKQDYATAIAAPSDPSKTGYTFTGWDTEIPATMPAKDMTITAQWTINQYTITFNADGGTDVAPVTADYLSEVAAPTAPTKDGYTFGGWATTKGVTDETQAVTFPVTMPLNGTTYYAIWVVNQYTINFDVLGGTPAVDSVTADYLSDVAKPATEPTKTGYTFGGWSEVSGSTTAVAFPYEMPLNGTTLYAIWNINSYTVTWDNEGTTSTESYEYGATITAPTEPTKTGYTFKGWNGYTDGMTMPAENQTFTAVWEANMYPATFNTNDGAFEGGETSKSIDVAYDSDIVFTEVPVRAGYEFNGWTPAVGKMDDVNGKTFEATWLADTDITYSIATYVMDTEGNYGEATIEKKAGTTDSPVSVTPETKEGFTLDTENSVLSGVVAADGSTTLVVKYIRNQYDFTVDVDGTQTTTQYYYEAAVAAPATPTKEGYTFDKWADENGAAVTVPTEMPANNVAVYATWTINKHSVIYMVDGAQYSKIDGIEYGSTVTPIAEPTKEGYTFSGWDKTEAFAMPDEDVTISGTFTANDYTITFVSNGGSPVASITQPYGSDVTAPEDPTRDGYEFAGWYDENGNKVNVPATMPLNGITLKADWTAIDYTVTYYTDDTKAEVTYTRTAAYESDYTVPTPSKTGYTFDKWMVVGTDAESGLVPTATTQIPLGGAEYYATWAVNSYNLVYRAGSDDNTGETAVFPDDNSTVKTYSTPYGTAQADWDVPVDPEMAGSTFDGWIMTSAPATMPAQPVNIQAKWITENYTVIFADSLSDEIYSEETLIYNYSVSIPDDPEKEGYTFLYWADEDGNEVTPMDTMEDIGADGASITYTATWEANTYDAVFMVDGEIYETVPTKFNETIVAPADPAKTGYDFGGWTPAVGKMDDVNGKTFTAIWNAKGNTAYTVNIYTMGTDGEYGEADVKNLTAATDAEVSYTPEIATGFELNASSVTSGKVAADGSLVLNIYIDRTTYTLNTIVDGTETTTTDYLYGAAVTVAQPTKEGHTFSGWDKDVPATMPAENVTLTGSFTANVHSVTYYVDGVEHFSEDVAYGTEVKVLAPLTKEGYTFSGWDKADFTMPDEDVVINGTWTINKYDVIYMVDGVEYTRVEDVTYGTEVTAIEAPTKEGYTFSGWDNASFTMPASDVTVSGTFTVNTHDVIYMVDGVEYDRVEDVAYGTEVTAIEAPTKEGYTFSGWDNTAFTMPDADVTVSGTFTVNTHDVIYMVDGVEYDRTEDVAYGTEVTAIEAPTKEGYTFSGWDKTTFTMPDEDVVINGTWTINKYDVIYMVDGVEYDRVEDVAYGTEVTAIEAPTKEGYTFSGWDKASFTMPASDVTVSGTFTVNTHDVIYMVDGVEYDRTEDVAFGTEVTAIEEPTKTGYTFGGWDKTTFTMPDEDVIVSGTFNVNSYDVIYMIDGEEYTRTEDVVFGTEVTVIDAPTKTGYTFSGWDKTTFTMPAEDVTVNGSWTAIIYTITWVDGDDATEDTVQEYIYEQTIVAPEAPAKEGYNFIKWEDAEGNTPDDIGTMPTENLTFTALYEVSAYQVYYWVNGENVAVKSAEYGETILTGVDEAAKKVNLLTYATPEGYVFDGWYTDAAMTTKLAENATVGAARVDLYAEETAGEYDAIFYVDGAEYAVVPTTFGEEIALPEEPTKEGYTFTGWEPSVTIMAEEGMTFEATWVETADAYTATYMVDGEEYEKFAMAYGDELEVPADPDKEGYTFIGWTDVADGTTAVELPATMPTENLTYYAIFTINNYTVNFNNNIALDESPFKSDETEVYSTANYDFGETIVMPADPTNIEAAYYTFMGWTDVEGSDEVKYTAESVITMPAGDLELYAVYERVSVKLVPVSGSTTVIERNGVTESYNDSSVTTDPYETPANFTQYYIYGFTNKRQLPTEANLETRYITYTGDGRIEITRREGTEDYAKLGTGTLVTLYDNVTGEVVEQFYLIYFGDVTGDCYVTTADLANVNDEVSISRTWSSLRGTKRVLYMIKAANLDGSSNIYLADRNIIANAVNGLATIDQKTGTVS